jgi:hypothetical protein
MKTHLLHMRWKCQSECDGGVFILEFQILRGKVRRNRSERSCKGNSDLIDWADLVFVTSEREDGHLTFVENNFIENKLVCDLDVPDNYDRDDPESIRLRGMKIEQFTLLHGYPVEMGSSNA